MATATVVYDGVDEKIWTVAVPEEDEDTEIVLTHDFGVTPVEFDLIQIVSDTVCNPYVDILNVDETEALITYSPPAAEAGNAEFQFIIKKPHSIGR